MKKNSRILTHFCDENLGLLLKYKVHFIALCSPEREWKAASCYILLTKENRLTQPHEACNLERYARIFYGRREPILLLPTMPSIVNEMSIISTVQN